MRVQASVAAWATLCSPGLRSTPTVSMARRRPGREASCAAHPAPAQARHHERHRAEQTTLYRLVQQPAASLIAHTEASTGSELPRFIKDGFEVFLECDILAHGFLRLRCQQQPGWCCAACRLDTNGPRVHPEIEAGRGPGEASGTRRIGPRQQTRRLPRQ
jgi:hypothetical protein